MTGELVLRCDGIAKGETKAVHDADIGNHHGAEDADTERGVSWEVVVCEDVLEISLLRPGLGFRPAMIPLPASTVLPASMSVGVVGWVLNVNIDDGEGDITEAERGVVGER